VETCYKREAYVAKTIMEFIYEAMEVIGEGFSAFIGGFASLFLISLIIWMVLLFVLLFRELFTPGDIDFKVYFTKVWKMLKLSFEVVAYGAVILAPILIYNSEDKLTYSMVWVASILLTFLFLYLRKQNKNPDGKGRSIRFNRFNRFKK
jgi:hypothetical protein